MKKKIIIGLLVVIISIQFIRPEKNIGKAETDQDITHFVTVPANIMNILKVSCYDCHSNNTSYPWYSQINPLGLWLNKHIKDGKRHLNFSDFAKYDKRKMDHKLEETAEQVEEHEMPLSTYTLLHSEAKLNEEQIKLIVDWVKVERERLASQ